MDLAGVGPPVSNTGPTRVHHSNFVPSRTTQIWDPLEKAIQAKKSSSHYYDLLKESPITYKAKHYEPKNRLQFRDTNHV